MDQIAHNLPVDYDLARRIADAAIELFLECRDVHGMDEEQARTDAVTTVAEGASTRIDPPSTAPVSTGGYNSHEYRAQRKHWD